MTLATIASLVLPLASSNGLVSISVGLMIWTLLVFVISMVILAKFAFPKIQEALDKRQRAIEESMAVAERARIEANELMAQYRERLAQAREQADEIVTRARKTGEAQEAEALADAKQRRDELLEQTRREIEAETRRALSELRAQVADLTVLATEKVTRKVLTTDDQRSLVDQTVKELDFAGLASESGYTR